MEDGPVNPSAKSLCMAVCWLWGAHSSAQGSSPAVPQVETSNIIVKASSYAKSDVQIPVYTFKPAPAHNTGASGPWPVVIFSHGRSGSAAGRAATVPIPANGDAIRYWNSRGYAVVAAIRPGYGENVSHDPEDHGARWSGGSCSGPAEFGKTTGAAAHAMRSVHAWVVEQDWARKDRILLVGQSVGGLTTIAACGQSWPGVMGCINFAGGAGGNPTVSPGASCRADRLEEHIASSASSTDVPSLWLYSANDRFWGEQAPKRWHKAYLQAAVAAGQKAESEFFAAPPVGQDGHSLHSAGSHFWIPAVTAWLEKHGF